MAGVRHAGINILAAEDAQHVEMYLAPVSIDVPGQAEVETILSIDVRANTGVEPYLLGCLSRVSPGPLPNTARSVCRRCAGMGISSFVWLSARSWSRNVCDSRFLS